MINLLKMKKRYLLTFFLGINLFFLSAQDFEITKVKVELDRELEQMIFSMEVVGSAGDSVPTAIGSLDGAPVLGYVFPTNLSPTVVGFDDGPGILAMALTSHPDFDDTPLWDENADARYDNDGVIWHPHWVVLENDSRVPGGLSVKATSPASILPPTNPGMPMYMDSPGFPVQWKGQRIRCNIPLYRMQNVTDFQYDGVTVLMYVNTSDPNLPLLGVYEVYSIASGDLSLPYNVGNYSCDTLVIDVSATTNVGIINPERVHLYPNPASTVLQLDLSDGFVLGDYRVELYDSNGAQVYQEILNSATLSIDVQNWAKGMYVVRVVEVQSGISKGSKQLVLQ